MRHTVDNTSRNDGAITDSNAAGSIEQVVRRQRRRNRTSFLLGIAALGLIGGLWAGLTKEPLDAFGAQVFNGPVGLPIEVFPPPPFPEDFPPLPVPIAVPEPAFAVPPPMPFPTATPVPPGG